MEENRMIVETESETIEFKESTSEMHAAIETSPLYSFVKNAYLSMRFGINI